VINRERVIELLKKEAIEQASNESKDFPVDQQRP
jgi:hypothetical protein